MSGFLSAPRIWHLAVAIVLIFHLHAGIAFGSLYPTKPVSTTVFSAGRPAQLKWVEDGHSPRLGDFGRMNVQLLAGNSTYISTIARNISPLALSTIVYIPQIIPSNYRSYTIRFIPSNFPKHAIYTASFTIIPNPFSHPLAASHPPTPTASSPSPSPQVVYKTEPAPEYTTISRIVGTEPTLPSPSGKYLPSQQDNAGSSAKFGFGSKRTFRPASVGGVRRPILEIDLEKLKFRFLFVVWPATIGLLLSL